MTGRRDHVDAHFRAREVPIGAAQRDERVNVRCVILRSAGERIRQFWHTRAASARRSAPPSFGATVRLQASRARVETPVMGYDDHLANRVRARLGDTGGVTELRMFGGRASQSMGAWQSES